MHKAVTGLVEAKSYSLFKGDWSIDIVTEQLWLDNDSVVTVVTWQQHSDRAANGSVVIVLLAVNISDWRNGSFAV